jgi:glycosyltransferase involved in cell wall biosynthesis
MFSNGGVLVYPSLVDNCPYVLLEAMSTGIPIVTSSKGGIPEIININHCVVGNSENYIKEMSKKVKNILLDRELYFEIQNEELQHIRKFSVSTMVNKTLRVYTNIIKNGN